MHFNVAMRIFELAYDGKSSEEIVNTLKDEFGVNYTTEDIDELTEDVRKKSKPLNKSNRS